MKLKTILLSVVIALTTMLSAQTNEKKIAIGLFGGLNEYQGDLGSGLFKFDNPQLMGAANFNIYLNPSFNFGLQSSYGEFGFLSNKAEFAGEEIKGKKLDAAMLLEYKFNNGYLLPESSKLAPFITAGMGFANYSGERADIDVFPMDFIAPIGAGLKFQINQTFALQYKYLYNFTNHDTHDKVIQKPHNDAYGQHMLGLVLSFGKTNRLVPVVETYPDSDGDGVPDHLDRCPNTPKGVVVDKDGCPLDSDGDGVPDYLDKCPNTPKGVVVDKDGCPLDSDGDGVPDYLDECPDIPGPVENNGCPYEVTEMISLLEKIEFEFDSQVIKVESFPLLDHAYEVLKSNPSYKLKVDGHTDNIGTEEYNLDLSMRRARAVFYYLTLKGIDENRILYKGHGSSQPIDSNSTPEGRARNRRVEFKVTN